MARQESATHGVWMPSDRLPASNRVDVERRVTGGVRNHWHRRAARRQAWQKIAVHAIQDDPHVLDGADAVERHAAMRGASVRRHLEPVDAAMPDADPIDVERLGDDHVIDPRRLTAVPAGPATPRQQTRRSPRRASR